MHLFDHRRLDQLARELAAAAALVRNRQSQLHLGAHQLPWHSTAARVWELSLTGLLGEFGALGRGLDGLGDAVTDHGRQAARRAQAIRDVAGPVATEVTTSVGRIARAAADVARDAAIPPSARP